ncbi:related to Cytosine-specific methyltransferase [Sporisorium reilianum f. sp. reilianum]|uniref:Cytosine-specific methyltransferase n=1 Tax=Sporisorium reilianum f. sp. reilianum TaxID=72559 RepID=A0A2N8UNC5_9BASI|nr:related to Cytosine-specific methyltransferase [Sporisorium reilianum f. sp. reilianum]
MPSTKATPRKLIETTHTVAKVLSCDFGIRNGYECVNIPHVSPPPSVQDINSNTEAAAALKAFLAQQDGVRLDRVRRVAIGSSASLKTGDIVEIQQGTTRTLVLIRQTTGLDVIGSELVWGRTTILHDVLKSNEVFATDREVIAPLSKVESKIDPNTVVLRYAWDETKPAFTGLNEWARHMGSETDEVVYHEGDFVFLQPCDNAPLLDIVQVHRIRNQSVYVRYLHRQITQTSDFKHDRLLLPSEELVRVDRASFTPIAKCNVSLLSDRASSWTLDANDFFVTEEGAGVLRPECAPCTEQARKARRTQRNQTRLAGMEIMCGAGGLSLGLDLSGACETKFAIDADEDSVKTFRSHHPNAKVFCCDAGDALQRAISGRLSAQGVPFPQRGQVDVISAGPPCQGFSHRNRTAPREAAQQDPRNLLVCTVLGWVEHLQPKYLILENVEGFTDSKLGGRKQGMVKLVMKCLLDLGYAATCGFVQSGAFGCPQSRGRFVLLAARRDLVLPRLPLPTHQFLGRKANPFTWTDGTGKTYAAQRASSAAAMLPAITVSDAIGDLPRFDWKDPHQVYAGPDTIELERAQRGIKQLDVVHGQAAGFEKIEYATKPLNSYQERMRVFGGQAARTVSQHQTPGFNALAVERVVNVALRPGADYDSWSEPDVDKPALLKSFPFDRWQQKHFKYERIDGGLYFKALMTTPTAVGSMIHPDQRRIFSVRECARAQGFPDWIEFQCGDANVSSAYRQIGNAVPVPLAVALAKSLTAARMRDANGL